MKTALILITHLLGLVVAATAQEQEIPSLTVEKISDNLYQLVGGRGANSGMYIGENEVVLVDSKMDQESVSGILTAVEGFTDKPVRYLINTHSDGDHVNGNEFMPEDVVIIAHQNCREEFFHPGRDGTPSKWHDEQLMRFVPQVTFTNEMKLHMGTSTLELYYFGVGHTTGDIVVYFPKEKTAFIGDQVFFERPQLIHAYKGGNSFEHVTTTELILETLDAEMFCSGHAGIKTREDIENHLREIKELQQKIKSYKADGRVIEDILTEFLSDHKQLVTTIFNEIKE